MAEENNIEQVRRFKYLEPIIQAIEISHIRIQTNKTSMVSEQWRSDMT